LLRERRCVYVKRELDRASLQTSRTLTVLRFGVDSKPVPHRVERLFAGEVSTKQREFQVFGGFARW
jgi:hypothetical protein